MLWHLPDGPCRSVAQSSQALGTFLTAHLLKLLNSHLSLLKLPVELPVAALMLSSLLLQSILLSSQSLIVLDQPLNLSEVGLLVLRASPDYHP